MGKRLAIQPGVGQHGAQSIGHTLTPRLTAPQAAPSPRGERGRDRPASGCRIRTMLEHVREDGEARAPASRIPQTPVPLACGGWAGNWARAPLEDGGEACPELRNVAATGGRGGPYEPARRGRLGVIEATRRSRAMCSMRWKRRGRAEKARAGVVFRAWARVACGAAASRRRSCCLGSQLAGWCIGGSTPPDISAGGAGRLSSPRQPRRPRAVQSSRVAARAVAASSESMASAISFMRVSSVSEKSMNVRREAIDDSTLTPRAFAVHSAHSLSLMRA